MGLYAESWLTELLVALSLVTVAVYAWFSQSYKYWQKKGVPYLEPQFPFGNIYKSFVGKQSMPMDVTDAYRQLKGKRFGGVYFFNRPSLLILDPDLIRNILVKDFWSFQDRGFKVDESDPLNKHLFLLGGNKWRRLRVKLSPTFTSGKMKMMFQTMVDCGRELANVLEEPASRGEVMEMREVGARYATDIIASVAFGIEVNCQRNPDEAFRQWGRKIFQNSLTRTIQSILNAVNPRMTKLIRLVRGESEVSKYFRKMVNDTVAYREENNVARNDFMHLLIQLKNKGCVDSDKPGQQKEADEDDTWKLSIDDVAAQAFVFFIAGFETSSTTMSYALHELAHHPDIQTRLQEEIDTVLKQHNGQITYDAINSMQYLEKVVAETLRKYPPVVILNRENNVEYKIPDSDVVLDKLTPILIPVYGLQHDPDYFPDPERFDPERFSEEQKAQRHPYVYLPFGEGPRICIGMRFGLLQTKVGLTHILSKYNIEPCEKTVRSLTFVPRAFVLTPEGGIQLRLSKRNKV
ncbi:cytochrome P450 6k1-like [Schistocerca nitens]|uniref:cytochrome P450 6k1-like n=1 Tax=Schistocerca nitens TaxID=7011 RepID=UPI0021185575|nr:cytochrome P450 6k1-like [Schistocerca nitens]XP_049815605.1 cytochrome P450 6k1-like [Schistocerca nitens]XP_049815606.1 cytochrome P450 6k1-like [Schistocerca nitens]